VALTPSRNTEALDGEQAQEVGALIAGGGAAELGAREHAVIEVVTDGAGAHAREGAQRCHVPAGLRLGPLESDAASFRILL
jgi:hypothetical protein